MNLVHLDLMAFFKHGRPLDHLDLHLRLVGGENFHIQIILRLWVILNFIFDVSLEGHFLKFALINDCLAVGAVGLDGWLLVPVEFNHRFDTVAVEDVLDLGLATERNYLLLNHESTHANTALNFLFKAQRFRIAIIFDKVWLNLRHFDMSLKYTGNLAYFVQLRVLRCRDVAHDQRLREVKIKLFD